MKVKCLNCGHEFETTEIKEDNLGTHCTCDECGASFDVNVDSKTSKYMNTYYFYYNQHRKIMSATSFDMVYLGKKHWFTPGKILFIEDIKTKKIRKYIVE